MKPSEKTVRYAAEDVGYVLSPTELTPGMNVPASRRYTIRVFTPMGTPKGDIYLNEKGAVSGAWGKSGINYANCSTARIAAALRKKNFGSGHRPDWD